jgi:hypothetical protein
VRFTRVSSKIDRVDLEIAPERVSGATQSSDLSEGIPSRLQDFFTGLLFSREKWSLAREIA